MISKKSNDFSKRFILLVFFNKETLSVSKLINSYMICITNIKNYFLVFHGFIPPP